MPGRVQKRTPNMQEVELSSEWVFCAFWFIVIYLQPGIGRVFNRFHENDLTIPRTTTWNSRVRVRLACSHVSYLTIAMDILFQCGNENYNATYIRFGTFRSVSEAIIDDCSDYSGHRFHLVELGKTRDTSVGSRLSLRYFKQRVNENCNCCWNSL